MSIKFRVKNNKVTVVRSDEYKKLEKEYKKQIKLLGKELQDTQDYLVSMIYDMQIVENDDENFISDSMRKILEPTIKLFVKEKALNIFFETLNSTLKLMDSIQEDNEIGDFGTIMRKIMSMLDCIHQILAQYLLQTFNQKAQSLDVREDAASIMSNTETNDQSKSQE